MIWNVVNLFTVLSLLSVALSLIVYMPADAVSYAEMVNSYALSVKILLSLGSGVMVPKA